MKKNLIALLLLTALPMLVMAQSSDDDLYYIPKKKSAVKKVETPVTTTTTVTTTQSPAVVVRDTKGRVRDVDEYNRRYTSRDNTFSVEDDTIYIDEKPVMERGEWVDGFKGSESDYEYSMRIIRFRSPRYAIPVSSPLYWDIVYGVNSWDWNIFEDGMYAYVIPSSYNPMWWDWRFSYTWGWGGFYSPWRYSSWYHSPFWGSHWGFGWHSHWAGSWGGYWGWGHSYWGGFGYHHHHNHWTYHPNRWSDSRRFSANHTGSRFGLSNSRGVNSRRSTATGTRSSRNQYVGSRTSRTSEGVRSSGRVVRGDGTNSVRQRTVTRNADGTVNRSANRYTRPATGEGSGYNRPSSTRSNQSSGYRRSSEGSSRSSSVSRSSDNSRSNSFRSSGSSSRSSVGSGFGGSRSGGFSGGHSGGGGSRSGGGRR